MLNVGNKLPPCAVESHSTQPHDEINKSNSAKQGGSINQSGLLEIGSDRSLGPNYTSSWSASAFLQKLIDCTACIRN
jgi:hypothetical protein